MLPAVVAIGLGQFLRGGDLSSLLERYSALIVGPLFVVGSTVILRAPKLGTISHEVRKALRGVPGAPDLIERIVKYCSVLRVEGPNAVQAQIGKESYPTLATGLTLIVSNISPEAIRPMMERTCAEKDRHSGSGAEVLETTGRYLLTFGVLGALLGMLYSFWFINEPAKVGTGIASAVLATIWGVGLASLVMFPIAKRIRAQAASEKQLDRIVAAGINHICAGMTPAAVKELLTAGKPGPRPVQGGARGR